MLDLTEDKEYDLQNALDASLEDLTTASESASVLSDDLQQMVNDNLLTEKQAIEMMPNT